ncbi:hypothetical protein [Nostoc sp. TCL26-01]|uniref:hypothetical protein n=1 Tax=Nostoc sp. TCL26-01 TaxID=2576904 RepID=UPI0015B9D793|nr:hypothetical protein [Nostoc sp. TCL26-01]QLE54838.1 hypothetical protein FD725_04495 [Nostoc sp. TCL26-01]QLE58766.1 hypothetical protein FD725_26640 [Nostoc sp. TCL26-01]
MPLPDNTFEHLQDVIRKQHNAKVRDFFSDLGGEDWEPEIATNRGSLRTACTILDNDTAPVMEMRFRLFYDILGVGKEDLVVFHGVRNDESIPVEGRPLICFYFSQDAAATPDNLDPVDAEYSFRIMDETQATFTEAKARTLGLKIKQEFIVSGKGIVFTKGKNIYKYVDEVKGYRNRIYSNSEPDAIDVIRRLLACQNFTFDDDKLTVSQPKKNSTSTTATHLVYGKQRKKKRFRPIANIRFRYAYMSLPGMNKDVFLVDTTGRYNPLVK